MVLGSAPCAKLSVDLSGFCGRSTPPHRESGDGVKRSSEGRLQFKRVKSV